MKVIVIQLTQIVEMVWYCFLLTYTLIHFVKAKFAFGTKVKTVQSALAKYFFLV